MNIDKPKWWTCKTSLDTPAGLNIDEMRPFSVFQLETGWFFTGQNCDQVFGPDVYETAAESCGSLYTLTTGKSSNRIGGKI